MKNCFLKISCIGILLLAYSLPAAVQHEQLNRIFGVPFFNSSGKWSRRIFEQTVRSAGLRFHGSDQLRISRSCELVLDMTPKEIRGTYNADDLLTVIDVIYSNKGDDGNEKNIRKLIRNTARTLKKKLTSHFGQPLKCDYWDKKLQNNAI